jgi:hexosaminidase
VRFLSWYKLNDLQLHLNDNALVGKSARNYSAFRLRSANPAFAGLAASDGSYTRAQWDELEDVAASHALNLTPEIDAPAHAAAFLKFDPALKSEATHADELDLSDPASAAFMQSVYREFVPWFRSPRVHIGADEYHPRQRDDYIRYLLAIHATLAELGKTTQLWGGFSKITKNPAGVPRDIVINAWNDGFYSASTALVDGFKTIDSNDDQLYLVPFADYYQDLLDIERLFLHWSPGAFGAATPMPHATHAHLLGAAAAVWNDLLGTRPDRSRYTEQDIHALIEPVIPVLAQKMWAGKASTSLAEFRQNQARMGNGPGLITIRTQAAPAANRAIDAAAGSSSSTPPN